MPPDRRSGPDIARTATAITPPAPPRENDKARITAGARRCPLQAAAARLGDPEVTAAVAWFHPAHLCPARRRSAA
jgi:hypothetical protein